MAPLTKETQEAVSPAAETAAPRSAAPAAASNHLRSDAVSLEIPIKIHGSRVTEVVRGVTPHTEPFEEQTTTMIVFAQGGVVKMSTPVTVGQMMVLTNLKSRQDVICRVLKVRTNPNLQAYVEVEFTHPQPGYWGVFFPSDELDLSARPANAAQSLSLESETKRQASPDSSRQFAPAPTVPANAPAKPPVAVAPQSRVSKSPAAPSYPPVASQKPGSAFISIGSQEEVQVAASSTLPKNASLLNGANDIRPVSAQKRNPAGDAARVSVAPSPSASGNTPSVAFQGEAQSVSMISPEVPGAIESESELHSSASEEPSASASRSTFGEFGSGPGMGSSREVLGSGLGMAAVGTSARGTRGGRNWLLIAACVLVAAVAVVGGTMYFLKAPASGAASGTVSATPPAPEIEASRAIVGQDSQTDKSADAVPANTSNTEVSAPATNVRANAARPSKVIVTDNADSAEAAPSTPVVPNVTPTRVLAGTLNARPVTSHHAKTNQSAAPALDAGLVAPAMGGDLPGMPVSASNALPPPPPGAPSRVGGVLKGPRLVSSIPPVYPQAAKQAMVDGDVVIHAVIDTNGNVSGATVISGPAILRDSALSAVRRWKYAPSQLDGQPVESETTVTVKFRR